jgi:hypothetical protein
MIILKIKFSHKKMMSKRIYKIIQKLIHLKIDKTIMIKMHSEALVIKISKIGERLEMTFKTKVKIKTWI